MEGTRSFAREAIETLAAVAIGGGLGKAAAIYGSVATLGAKPGLTSTSFKPGMVGATPAQLAAIHKPGLVGATAALAANGIRAIAKARAAAGNSMGAPWRTPCGNC